MRRQVRWADFCRDHGVAMSGSARKGLWLEVRCPFCGDKHFKGAIQQRKGLYTCWKCGSHSISEFVSATCGVPDTPRDMMRALEPYFTETYETVRVTTNDDINDRRITVQMLERNPLKLPGTSPLGPAMRAYLKRRGFKPKYMERKYGLKDGGIVGEWAYRLMIPVVMDGRLVTWQGRHIGDNVMRYKAAASDESLNIKDTLYNLDNCHLRKVIAVEGIFDCWKLGDDCIAMFGISLKDSQIRLLADRFDEVYILFDPEDEAQARARECARKLSNVGVKAHVLRMEDTDSEDPGDLTPDEVRQIKSMVFGEDYDNATPWLRTAKETKV